MLLDEDPRAQRVGRISVEHRHRPLNDDRSAIELRRHQVHGHAADLDAVLERLALRVDARKRRQQRRVDVQDGVRKRLEERRADQPHVAGQADEPDIARLQLARQRAIVARRATAIRDGRCRRVSMPACRARSSPAASARFEMTTAIVASRRPSRIGVDERLEIAAAARDQHAEAPVHDRLTYADRRRLAGNDLADHARVAAAARGELLDQLLAPCRAPSR